MFVLWALDISQFSVVSLILLMVLNVLCSDSLINILYNIHIGIMSINDLLDNYFIIIVENARCCGKLININKFYFGSKRGSTFSLKLYKANVGH